MHELLQLSPMVRWRWKTKQALHLRSTELCAACAQASLWSPPDLSGWLHKRSKSARAGCVLLLMLRAFSCSAEKPGCVPAEGQVISWKDKRWFCLKVSAAAHRLSPCTTSC